MIKFKRKKNSIPNHILIFKYTFCAIYASLIFGLQIALAAIPNVHLTTFLLCVGFVILKPNTSYIITNTYIGLMLVTFGFTTWNLMYFLIFNAYGTIAYLLKNILIKWPMLFCLLIAFFGYIFGLLFTLQEWFLNGFSYALAYFIRGLMFDFIHGTSNFLVGIFLLNPVIKAFTSVAYKYEILFNKKFLKTIDT